MAQLVDRVRQDEQIKDKKSKTTKFSKKVAYVKVTPKEIRLTQIMSV